MDWIGLLQTVGGIIGGFGIGSLTKSGRVKSKADAYKAVCDGYEARISALHDIEKVNNATILEQGNTIASLNHALDDKTLRIRELTNKLWEAERETNRVNDLLNAANERIVRLTEERDQERLHKEYYKRWRCEWPDCHDPRGRKPPNKNLDMESFEDPEKQD